MHAPINIYPIATINMEESNEKFVYFGGGMVVPKDITHARVHPSVTIIPEKAFHMCGNLVEVELCEGLLEIREEAFYKCKSLQHISIPSTVTVIPKSTFFQCIKLEKVELNDGLLEIGNHAFYWCSALKQVDIPSSVTIIDESAFTCCKQLEEIKLSEGLVEIRKSAFFCCESLKVVSKIPSTVTNIGVGAFERCSKLVGLELCEGLLEVSRYTFSHAESFKHIIIPSSVTSIGSGVFCETALTSLHLSDGIESIGEGLFKESKLVKFRLPPQITTVPKDMFEKCSSLFSLEVSKSATHIGVGAFSHCCSLRNMAFPYDAEMIREERWAESYNKMFKSLYSGHTDLQRLFSSPIGNRESEDGIIHALKHRFDNLPIHKMIYYQSYFNMTVDQLDNVTSIRRGHKSLLQSKIAPSGKEQDRLGMTPLHIMACSSVQNIELYTLLINKYPENLTTKDKWRALPLLYAVWGNAPNDIVQFLVESYQTLYPDFKLNWTDMLVALGEASVGLDVIQNLLDIRKNFFPGQHILWGVVLDKPNWEHYNEGMRRGMEPETFLFLLKCSIATRIKAIGMKSWRTEITGWLDVNKSYNLYLDEKRWTFLEEFETKLRQYETEYRRLREATTVLELVLWKQNLDKQKRQRAINTFFEKRKHKKMKIEASDLRKQCRINCKADIVIEHVLPYLVSKPVVQFSIDEDSDSESEDDDW